MNLEEFNRRKKELDLEHSNKLYALAKECALSNNPHKIGDIISDSTATIKIELIGLNPIYHNMPTCVYYGAELKKDGAPKKTRGRTAVFQSCVVKAVSV